MKLSPQAQRIWEAIAPDQRLRILNSVWCVGCMKSSSMGNISGKIENGRLSLSGVCTHCGGVVAKIVEANNQS
jgi:isochorismate hydrolase